jgi:hypothetical protein
MKLLLSRVAATVLSAGLLAGACGPASARPMIPAERRVLPYGADLPACGEPSVLSRIANTFRQKESEYWSSALEIVGYDRIGQTGYRSNGSDYIPRRYCVARASLNDNTRRQVVYWVGEDLGIIGFGFGVEWCVVGLDRNWAYGPACRAARP